jgi:hypothetical protein
MLTNRIIIWISIVVLSIPALLLGARLLQLSGDTDRLSCDTFHDAFETYDNVSSVTQRSVLIISSTLDPRWQSTSPVIGGFETIIRGHKQITPNWVGQCFARLVGHYQPRHLIILLDSGLFLRSDDRLREDLSFILNERKRYHLDMTISIIGALKTPANLDNATSIDAGNQAIEAWANSQRDVRFVAPNARFTGLYRQPNPSLFWPDGQTLSDLGNEAMISILRQEIDAISLEP